VGRNGVVFSRSVDSQLSDSVTNTVTISIVSESAPIKQTNTCVTMVMEVLLLHNMVKAFLFWVVLKFRKYSPRPCVEYTHHTMHCMQIAESSVIQTGTILNSILGAHCLLFVTSVHSRQAGSSKVCQPGLPGIGGEPGGPVYRESVVKRLIMYDKP
jgi:hypothetical protein